MKVCGIEIRGSEAVICILELKNNLFTLPECRARKVEFATSNKTADVRAFQFAFSKLMQDYSIKNVVIKERPTKGKFAGGTIGFKLEAAIQLIPDLDVETLSASELKAGLKRDPVHIPFPETGLKVFQEQAFITAFTFLNIKRSPYNELQ